MGLLVVTPLGTLGALTWLKPFIAARLSADRGEALIWGALPAVVVGVAWAVFALVYRSGVRAQSEGLTLPQPSPSAKLGAAWASFWRVVLVALFAWVAMFPIPRRVGRTRPPTWLSLEYPHLWRGLLARIVLVLVVAWLGWVLVAVRGAWTAYRRRYRIPALVDGEFDLGGPSAVKILYRPTLGLGAPLQVRLGGRSTVAMVPGQALGLRARSGGLVITVSGRGGVGAASQVIELRLAKAEGTLVVIGGGLFRRVRVEPMPEIDRFAVAAQPFVTLWSGLSYLGILVTLGGARALVRRQRTGEGGVEPGMVRAFERRGLGTLCRGAVSRTRGSRANMPRGINRIGHGPCLGAGLGRLRRDAGACTAWATPMPVDLHRERTPHLTAGESRPSILPPRPKIQMGASWTR